MADYKKGAALLANIFKGIPLPPEYAKKTVTTDGAGVAQAAARLFNDDVAKRAAAKMDHAPLVAVCYSHVCKCGNRWEGFGFYGRHVTERAEGIAPITFVKPIDYDPSPELPSSTEWQEREEQVCISCYKGPTKPVTLAHPAAPTPIVILEQYRHKAREEVDGIREDALNQRIASYTARAIKRVTSVLPYGLEDAIPQLPELVATAKREADQE